jgi:hypothetical protein
MNEERYQGAPVVIHKVWSDQEAAIVVACLGEYGIQAVTNSAVPHEVLPITVDGLGAVEILVGPDQAEKAKRILMEHLKMNQPGPTETSSPES